MNMDTHKRAILRSHTLACAHTHTQHWFSLHFYLLTPPTAHVDASCYYYPCGSRAIKAGKCVFADPSAAEMFYQEK